MAADKWSLSSPAPSRLQRQSLCVKIDHPANNQQSHHRHLLRPQFKRLIAFTNRAFKREVASRIVYSLQESALAPLHSNVHVV